MSYDGSESGGAYEQALDLFVAQLDTVRGRALLMVVAALAVVAAGHEFASGIGDEAIWTLGVWAFIILGNLVTVYILATYRKPSGVIEQEILG